jgi:O-antigen/teichoic acid export membrane protein
MTPKTSAILLVENSTLPTGPNPFSADGVLGSWMQLFRQSGEARTSMRNSLYGAAEYVALPLAMLLATPFLLRRLGPAQYGLWMLATAAVTSSGLISTGFGDAALKYAATYRGKNDRKRLEDTLRVNLTINLVLGAALALIIWHSSPLAVRHLFKGDPAVQRSALAVFRIASMILLIRSVEGVFVGALRAFERYGPAVQINVLWRIATVLCACFLVSRGNGVVAIMLGTIATSIASTVSQMTAARMVMGPIMFYPSVSKTAFSEVFGFGCFSWLQTLAGCIFSYADRLLLGFLLGTSSVAYYSVCVQAAQPIHGLIAAGLHFSFPHLSARLAGTPASKLRPLILRILSINLALAALLSLPLMLFSKLLLRVWMGAAFAQQNWVMLSTVAAGFGLLALNITGHYALLAMEQVRLVAILNVIGGIAMLACVLLLAPRMGLLGAAVGRLIYGPVTLLMYWRLRTMLSPGRLLLAGVSPPLAIVGQDSP